MSIWFTSDTHFFHQKLANIRGFSSSGDMNEALRDAWNRLVKPKDTVWHLGDVSFAKLDTTIPFIESLNGIKHLILGNHDKMYRPKITFLEREGIFGSVQDFKMLKAGGAEFHLSHYGHRVWNKSHYGSIHLYGHSHGHLEPYGKSVDVGVDANWISPELRPYHLEEVIAYMATRENHEKNFRGDYE